MAMALRYFHTLEDWQKQRHKVTKLDPSKLDCLDCKTVIKLDTLEPAYHRLISSRIEFDGTVYEAGNASAPCTFVVSGTSLVLPIPCPEDCFIPDACSPCGGIDVRFEYLSMPKWEISCETVTGSWLYDQYPEILRDYAYQYARAILDGKIFRYVGEGNIEVLRSELLW